MKVYVLLIDEAYDGDQGSFIGGVYATKELARKALNERVAEMEGTTNYDTIDKDEDSYEAYDEGWYAEQHFSATIHEQDISE